MTSTDKFKLYYTLDNSFCFYINHKYVMCLKFNFYNCNEQVI